MLTLGEYTYVKNDKEAMETLFKPINGKTFSGYYKKLKGRVLFSNIQGEIFAALVKVANEPALFVNAGKINSGKVFYQYALGQHNYKRLGLQENLTYSQERAYAQTLADKLGL